MLVVVSVGGFVVTALAGFGVIPAWVGYPLGFAASAAIAFMGTGD